MYVCASRIMLLRYVCEVVYEFRDADTECRLRRQRLNGEEAVGSGLPTKTPRPMAHTTMAKGRWQYCIPLNSR